MYKKLFSCLLAFALSFALCFCASAIYTFGRGGESDSEPNYASIAELYTKIYETYGVDAYFVSATEFAGENSAKEFASQYVTLLPDTDWVLFVRTEDDAMICTNGACTEVFDSDMIERLYGECLAQDDSAVMMSMQFFAGVARELRDYVLIGGYGEIESATAVFSEDDDETTEAQTTLVYGVEDVSESTLPAVDAAPQKQSVVKPVLICAVLGLVIALIVTLSVKGSYKPVQRKRDAAQYMVDGSLRVTGSYDTFVRSETSERKIEKQDPSGSK